MNKSHSALQALTRKTLEDENRRYTGRGEISAENRGLGFLPAYRDSATGNIHLSRFADGRRAPIHLLEGLPTRLALRREASGKVVALKGSVSAGFVREGRFYTREQAAMAMMREARDGNSPSSPRPVQASFGRAFFFSEPSMWPLVLWPQLPLGAFLRRALSPRTRSLTYNARATNFGQILFRRPSTLIVRVGLR